MSPNAGILEIVDTPLFDTLSIPFGFSSRDRAALFVVPFGLMFHDPMTGEARSKDHTETNMAISGQLPMPNSFVVRAIRAALFNRRGELLPIGSRHYRGAILELVIQQKPYWTGPLWKAADPATLFQSSNPLASFSAEERAEIIRSLRLQLPDSVIIMEQQPFSVVMKFDPSFEWERIDAPGSLVVLLEGTNARAAV